MAHSGGWEHPHKTLTWRPWGQGSFGCSHPHCSVEQNPKQVLPWKEGRALGWARWA